MDYLEIVKRKQNDSETIYDKEFFRYVAQLIRRDTPKARTKDGHCPVCGKGVGFVANICNSCGQVLLPHKWGG